GNEGMAYASTVDANVRICNECLDLAAKLNDSSRERSFTLRLLEKMSKEERLRWRDDLRTRTQRLLTEVGDRKPVFEGRWVRNRNACCSFCGEARERRRRFVPGTEPDVFICNECIRQRVTSRRERPSTPPP